MESLERIAIVDLCVTINSPAGSCVRSELIGLLERGVFVDLFTSECDLEHPNLNIKKIKVFNGVLFIKYLTFIIQCFFILKKDKYILVQSTQGQFYNSNISYAHFCHKAYLLNHWSDNKISGLRRISRFINHYIHAKLESITFHYSSLIVVPSHGLRKEISKYYPLTTEKIKVISNPVDLNYFYQPSKIYINNQRIKFGYSPNDFVIIFSALGDFSRKGLDLLFEAIKRTDNLNIKLLVIGGGEAEIHQYQNITKLYFIENQVQFVGFQKDIRPFLCCGDIFSLPSSYEIAPLVTFQAAALGLPLLVTKLYGVEEFLIDRKNGWEIKRNSESICEALIDILTDKSILTEFSANVRKSVIDYNINNFSAKWFQVISKFYK